MPELSEWMINFTEQQRQEFLHDMDKFDSYSKSAYELANAVVSNFREKYNLNVGEITIGNKGGYLLIVVVLPRSEYEYFIAENIQYYLGFNICFALENII